MSWLTIFLVAALIGGLFSMVMIVALSRSATGGDIDWQLARVERKVDLILTHLGIGHDDHVPDIVVDLAQAGRTIEAIQEYRRLTGTNQAVAKREVEYLIDQMETKKGE